MSDPTRVEHGDDDPSTVDAPVRWKGAAAVIPPAPKKSRWKPRQTFMSTEPDADNREAIPAVDPWAGQDPEDTPWDAMPVAPPPPMPPTRLEQLPPTRLEQRQPPRPERPEPPVMPTVNRTPEPPVMPTVNRTPEPPVMPTVNRTPEPPVMPTVNRLPVQPRSGQPRPGQPGPMQARPVPPPPPRPAQKQKKRKEQLPQKYVQQTMKERPHPPAPPPRRKRRRGPFRALFKLAIYTVILYVLATRIWPVVEPDVSAAVPELVAYITDVVLQNL